MTDDPCLCELKVKDVICDCSNRGLTKVPRYLPNETTSLNLYGNNLNILRNDSFDYLSRISELNMGSSKIRRLEPDVFKGLYDLRDLYLGYNYFASSEDIPEETFRNTPKLRSLNLEGNAIGSNMSASTLRHLDKLQSLILSPLDGAVFGDGFRHLKSLTSLSLVLCFMETVTNNTFLYFSGLPVTYLALHCRLGSVQPGALVPFSSIDQLCISGNLFLKISDLAPVLSPFKDKNMTTLIFDRNYVNGDIVDSLSEKTFSYFGDVCIRHIDLSGNRIAYIEKGSIKNSIYRQCLETLDVSENHIHGNVEILFELQLLSNLKYFDFSEQTPTSKDISNKYRGTNTTIEHPLLLEFYLPPSLVTIKATELIVHRTPLAFVQIKNGNHLRTLDFSGTEFENCNGLLEGLDNLEFFGMSDFNCSVLNPRILSPFKKLRQLNCDNTNLNIGFQSDPNGTFLHGLTRLEHISAGGNGLERLHEEFFTSQYKSLSYIDLSYNKLSKFPFDISNFRNLTYINFKSNRLLYIDDDTIAAMEKYAESIDHILHIDLDENMLQCNCESLKFIKWLFSTRIKLERNGNYTCTYKDGTIKTTEFAYQNINALTKQCSSLFWVIFSACLSFVTLVSIVLCSIAYKYRITLNYWYLKVRRKYKLYSKLDETNQFKYKAFIAYHQDNRKWVCGPLLKFLEVEKKLSVCIHDRDFMVGGLIADNIFDAVSESEKIILVISKSFLQSTWCEYELEMARMKMYSRNRDMLIVVMVERIEPDDMPGSLLRIWNQITCLETEQTVMDTDEPNFELLFWKRLYESLVI